MITVDDAQVLKRRVDLKIDWSIENSIAGANDGLVIAEWIPGQRNTWRKIICVRPQRRVPLIQFVTNSIIERKIVPSGPRILPEPGDERIRRFDLTATKTLLVKRRETQSRGLKSIDACRRHTPGESTTRRSCKARTDESSRQIAEEEAARKENMRVTIRPPKQYVTAGFHTMAPTEECNVVGKFIVLAVGQRGQKHIPTKGSKAVDLKLGTARIYRSNIKPVIDVLGPHFIHRSRAELVKPGAHQCMAPGKINVSSLGSSDQRL